MVFAKKKGRPKGSIKAGNESYTLLNDEEKREYQRKATQKSREKSANASTSASSTSATLPSPRTTSTSAGAERTEKPVPLTPNSKKKRKAKLQKLRRKKSKICKDRQSLQVALWRKRQTTADDSDLENLSSSSDEDSDQSQDNNNSASTDSETEFDQSENESSHLVDLESNNLNRSFWRYKSTIKSVITTLSPLDSLVILKQYLINKGIKESLLNTIDKVIPSIKGHSHQLTYEQVRYKARKLVEKTNNASENQLIPVLQWWMDTLLKHPYIENQFSDFIQDLKCKYVSKDTLAKLNAKHVAQSLLTTRTRTTDPIKRAGIEYVIRVAKSCALSSTNRGDAALLSQITFCDRTFSMKVLTAIETNNLDLLFKRNLKSSAIKATHWPEAISSYVLNEKNSRAVPGGEQVSVRYNFRLPKFILLKSRAEIANEFKSLNPQCEFSISTIMREFPQNAVTPTSRDQQRNTCPVHANARRLVKATNTCLSKAKLERIPISTRELCHKFICPTSTSLATSPLSWDKLCIGGKCKSCPTKLGLEIPEHAQHRIVKYAQWKQVKKTYEKEKDGNVVTTEKSVFDLITEECTLKEATSRIASGMSKLKLHLYTAYAQWNAHETLREALDTSTIITIEDYQMNLEVVYKENPTALSYSVNKRTVAMYPICIEYKSDGELKKGAITFLTDDKEHSHQQIQQFEARMFEIVRSKLTNQKIVNWHRFSDGCKGQFKSGYVAADMFENKTLFELESIAFHYFESHEGKSISDSIGSIAKCAFLRAMMKHAFGIMDIDEVLTLIQSEIKPQTKKFSFFLVEKFGTFSKRATDNRSYCKVPGIMSQHSMKLVGDGIVMSQWTCLQCEVNKLCSVCSKKKRLGLTTLGDVESNDSQIDDSIQDESDVGQTDDSESDSDQDNETNVGDIVWAKYGRFWFPARICCLSDLPENLRSRFPSNEKVIVKWIGEDNYSQVPSSHVDELGENLVDAARAAKSKHIMKQYNVALGQKMNFK